ncbi:MAG TPA: ABC transporter permease subunit [Solirubrobacterales bacterium]|jgi:ABC-2 type transport system permease protein
MIAQLRALVLAHLSDRRRSLLAWGVPLGLWSAFIVMIFPSVEGALSKAVQNYPSALKEAFGIGELTSVEQYLHAELLSLIVPLAIGYLAVRAVASGLSGAAESGRLDVLLSAPVSRPRLAAATFAATAVEVAIVLVMTVLLTGLGSLIAGANLSLSSAIAGYANVMPLALVFAGLGIVATGFSLRTSVVTGSVAGVLVTMYVIDLVGRLDPGLSGIRYVSVFKYYGNAIEEGIDPLAFVGVTVIAIGLAAFGAWLFDRRDLAA